MVSCFPLDVLGEILDVIESVSEGFLTYSFILLFNQFPAHSKGPKFNGVSAVLNAEVLK